VLIKQVQLLGFGKFKNKTVKFCDGLNVVTGPNEAGKSTIQSAIYIAFFGKPKDYKRWGVGGRPCRIIIDYEADKTGYRLIRDLAAQEVSVRGETGDEFTNKKLVSNLIHNHIGTADAKIFENTTFIRANELAILESNENSAIKDRIDALMAGSRKMTASAAIKDLSLRYKTVAGTARQKGLGGDIGAIQAKLDGLDDDLKAAKKRAGRRERLLARVKETDASIAAQEKRLAELAPLLRAFKQNKHLLAVSQKRQAVSKRLEELTELNQLSEKLKREIGALGMDNLPAGVDKLVLLWEQSLKDRQPLGQRNEKLLDKYKLELKSSIQAYRLRMALAVFLALVGTATAFLYNPAAGIILAFIGVASAIPVLLKDKRSLLSTEISALEEEVKRDKSESEEQADGIANILLSTKSEDSRDFLNKYSSWEDKRRELRLVEDKIDILLGDDNRQNLKAARRDLLDEEERMSLKSNKSIREALNTITATEIIGKEELYDEIKSSVAKARDEKLYLEGRLRELEKETYIVDIEEEIAYLNNKKSQEVLRAKALMSAKENLEVAAQEVSGRIIPQLALRSKDYFYKFIADEEREFSLDNHLRITLSGETDLTGALLSTATRDQVFFALRLAIAELIFSEVKPPLILDDPFVHFDESRFQRVVSILEELAKNQQIILFSHASLDNRITGKFSIITL